MKRIVIAAAAIATLAALPARAADPVEGVWLTQARDAHVRIAPCAGDARQMCGVVIWLQKPHGDDGKPQADEKNPDPALRNRPVVGQAVIRDFRPVSPGVWDHGRIYDPSSGKTYDSKMRLGSDGTLEVAGCVLMFCQNQTWRRLD